MLYQYLCLYLIMLTFTLYLLCDGKALVMSALSPFLKKHDQARVFNALLPSWDANQTWLVFTLAALYGAFPAFFSAIFSDFYLLLITMLVLLILRGASIEFSLKEQRYRHLWMLSLSTSSALILAIQSYLLGYLILYCNRAQSSLLLHSKPVAIIIFYLLLTICVFLFHLTRCVGYLRIRLWCQETKYYSVLLSIVFVLLIIYHDWLIGYASWLGWIAHAGICVLLCLISMLIYNFKLKDRVTELYNALVVVVALGLVSYYQFPLIGLQQHSIFKMASSEVSLEIITIASLLILPILLAMMLLLQHLLKQTSDRLGY